MFRQEKNGGGRVPIISAEEPLPPKTSILGVPKHNVQLNKMLAGARLEERAARGLTRDYALVLV